MLNKGVLSLLIIALALLASPGLAPARVTAAPITWVVDDDPDPCEPAGTVYTHIADALEAANPDDTIRVCEGDYTEPMLNVDDVHLTITGSGTAVTHVHHSGAGGAMLTILADYVVVQGLDLDAGEALAAIDVENNSVSIENNEIRNASWTAVYAVGVSNVGVLSNNIHDNQEGIVGDYCDGCVVSGNTVRGDPDGISLSNGNGGVVTNNVVYGDVVALGDDLFVANNHISGPHIHPLMTVEGHYVRVADNALDTNDRGIDASLPDGGGPVTIARNTFTRIDNPIRLEFPLAPSHPMDVTIGRYPADANTFIDSGGSLGDSSYLLRLYNITTNVYAQYNKWGLCTAAEIEQEIYDKADDPALGAVDYEPFIAPEDCPEPSTPTPTATPTPAPTATPTPTKGQVFNCPGAGKWTITVWEGADDTDADEVLATCGEEVVDAAYALNPDTQSWLRWFADHPEFNTLGEVSKWQGVIALGKAEPGPASEPPPSAANEMHNCPDAGLWAIAVWEGVDGIDTGEALGACREEVEVAYALDPGTQNWLRWFAEFPEISTLLTVKDKEGLIARGKATPAAPPGRIAFRSNRDGNWEIYVMDGDGTGETRLTYTSGTDSRPVWSPDGSQIAFGSCCEADWDIYVINADGTGQTRLTNSPAADENPVWSPDGSQIAFESTRDGNREIYVMNADGTGQTRLTNDPAYDGEPAWRPGGGGLIAFNSDRDGNMEVYVMSPIGFNQINWSNNPADDAYPVWSPDGTKIAFGSDRDGQAEIYVMDWLGLSQTRLSNDPALDSEAVWSPDGSQIAFFSTRAANGEIYVMKADGTAVTRLTNSLGGNLDPSWAPDSSKIAFESMRDGNWEVYVVDVNGEKNLTNHLAFDQDPVWSPPP